MKFVDKDNQDEYLASYPDKFHQCFIDIDNRCSVDRTAYIYENNKIKIEGDEDIDKTIDVTTIRLPKGDKGDSGMDAFQPTIKFYYVNSTGQKINDTGSSIEVVQDDDTHIAFHESPGDCGPNVTNCPDEIKVNVTRHENCTHKPCDECTGDTYINTITAIDEDAVTVNGNINTNNIILNEGGKICIGIRLHKVTTKLMVLFIITRGKYCVFL